MAKYPRELCRAVLRGITRQLHADRRMKPGCYGVQAVDDEEEIKQHSYGPEQGFSGRFRGDLTGQVLRDDLVLQARMKELEFFHNKGVLAESATRPSSSCHRPQPYLCEVG